MLQLTLAETSEKKYYLLLFIVLAVSEVFLTSMFSNLSNFGLGRDDENAGIILIDLLKI